MIFVFNKLANHLLNFIVVMNKFLNSGTSNICSYGSAKDFALSGSSPFELFSIIESRRLPAMDSRLLISRLRREFFPTNRLISRSAAAFSPWKCRNIIKLMAQT